MPKFALIGAAGYVAPKHFKAIKDVGGELVIAHDIHDSVGILDSYFKNTEFTTDMFDFRARLFELQGSIDYFVVCTPNYEHLKHCYLGALGATADVICEKPIVLHEREIDMLNEMMMQTHRQVYPILQMRYAATPLPVPRGKKARIIVNYHTPRGPWYHNSWKGDDKLSGGIVTNIGIHLFDWLTYHYGKETHIDLYHVSRDEVCGTVELERASVEFQLSTSRNATPQRTFQIDSAYYDLTHQFNDLHTTSYQAILEGRGFCPEDCRNSVRLVGKVRNLCQQMQ